MVNTLGEIRSPVNSAWLIATEMMRCSVHSQSLSAELEESSRVCGQSFIGTIRKITVPLLRPGIFAAYLMLFIMFIRELPVSALLATEESTPMAVALYVISENEALGVVSAFALVQAGLLLAGTVVFRRLGNIEKLSV